MIMEPHARQSLLAVASTCFARAPDFIVGGEDPYLLRWYLTGYGQHAGAYVHRFLRSDDDRALHDHPYDSTSVILQGSYIEHLAHGVSELRQEGWVGSRRAADAHRVELLQSARGVPLGVTTLFLHGARVRDWGFHCPQGWRPWQEFVAARDKGAIGVGCG